MQTVSGDSMISRRMFLQSLQSSALLLAAGSRAMSSAIQSKQNLILFSKQLEWITDYRELAETVAEIGFDGLELTTRPGGHVVPERVEEDLPRMAEAARQAGIDVTMIATRITDPDDPVTHTTLKTAQQQGIPFYRMGGLSYPDTHIAQALGEYKAKFKALSQINKEYHIHGAYQCHAGRSRVSAGSWDLWLLLRDLDPQWIGCEYDTRHTQLENGSWWHVTLKLLAPFIKTMVIKDFKWASADDRRRAQNCPVGEGEVDFDAFFTLHKELGLSGPMSLHFPWMNNKEMAKLNHKERKKQTINIMQQTSLNTVNRYLKKHEL